MPRSTAQIVCAQADHAPAPPIEYVAVLEMEDGTLRVSCPFDDELLAEQIARASLLDAEVASARVESCLGGAEHVRP